MASEGREGECESRVFVLRSLGRSIEGEAARRAARECGAASVKYIRQCSGTLWGQCAYASS